MQFKIGDKVIIREDLSLEEAAVVSGMLEFRGKTVTILLANHLNEYYIEEDCRRYYWPQCLFKGRANEKFLCKKK